MYNKFALVYDRLYSPKKYWALIDDLFAGDTITSSKPNMLDLGCGTGAFLLGMYERGWNISGLDISPGMLDCAKQKSDAGGIPCALHQKDMLDFHVDGQFDLITSNFDTVNYVLEIKDLERLFKNAYSLLRKNGSFAFDVVTKYQAQNFINPFIKEFEDVRLNIVPHYDQVSNIKKIEIDIVSGSDKVKEIHLQRMYDLDIIDKALRLAGFSVSKMLSIEGKTKEITDSSTRVYFVAKKT